MKIYLAARYSRMEELRAYKADLEKLGHEVTSRWLSGAHDGTDGLIATEAVFANEDVEDVLAADILISFTEAPDSPFGRGGRHVEFGIALSAGKRLIVVGYRENVFHCLANVEFYTKWAHAISDLMPTVDIRECRIAPVELDDRVDGRKHSLPDGVRRLSPEGFLAIWKIGVRQMALMARFKRK